MFLMLTTSLKIEKELNFFCEWKRYSGSDLKILSHGIIFYEFSKNVVNFFKLHNFLNIQKFLLYNFKSSSKLYHVMQF